LMKIREGESGTLRLALRDRSSLSQAQQILANAGIQSWPV
jgi:hypothetical protein